MKTPSDDLFMLVKSMNTREKGFFKVFSAKRSFNKNSLSYLQLFDAIDRMKNYDESTLINKLKKIGFKHHLNQAKNYLTKAIYNSLREYHSDISVSAELQQLLHLSEVLIKKKLLKPAKKLVRKAEKLALEYEMYEYLFVIRSLKITLFSLDSNIKDIEDDLAHGVPQIKEYLNRLKNIMEFNTLASEVNAIATRYVKAREIDIVNKINGILDSPLLSSPDKALSFSALRIYYLIHTLCSKLLDKCDDTTCSRQKEWITYLESDTIKLGERSHTYLIALANLMNMQLEMGRRNEAEKLYEKIKILYFSLAPKKRTNAMIDSFTNITSNYIHAQNTNGNPEKSLKVWEQIRTSVSFSKLYSGFFITICWNLSNSHFMMGNYHEALKWINKILNFREKNVLDAQAMARIFLLLIHYELGNYDALPYMAKSSRRFLEKHHFFSEFEKIMINFFSKKADLFSSKQKQSEIFNRLKKQLEPLFENAENTKHIRALAYFDYPAWLGGKIEKRPMVQIIQERVSVNFRKD